MNSGHHTQGRIPASSEEHQHSLSRAVELHQAGRLVEAEKIYRSILREEPAHADALHLLGLIAQHAGQAEAAIRLIQQAIVSNPMAGAYKANLAMVFEELGRYKEAEDSARAALALDQWNGSALHCLANALRARDQYDDAAEAYEKATRVINDDPALWSNFGATLQTLTRYESAVEAFRKALALSPGQAEMYSNLGNALLKSGFFADAVAAFKEGLRVDPQFVPGYTNLANALMQSGDAGAAGNVLRRCLEIRPGECKALAFLAAASEQTGDVDTTRSLMDYERFLAGRQWNAPGGYADLASFNKDLVDQVTRHYSLIWEPVSKTTHGGGQTGELAGADSGPVAELEAMIRTAIQDYLKALPADSDHPFAQSRPDDWKLTMWATVLERAGQQTAHIHPTGWLSGVYYACIPVADAAADEHSGWIEFGRPPDDFRITRDPEVRIEEPKEGKMFLFPSYFYHRTVPFSGEGKRVSIAFDVMPTHSGTEEQHIAASLSAAEFGAELERAEMELRTGNVAQAEKICRRLIEADDSQPHSHYLMGLALYRLRKIEESADSFRKALKLAPEEARYSMDLGTCCQQLQLDDEAVHHLERAADLNPGDTESLMRLATAHSDRGRFEEAQSAYERALERDPASGGVHYGLAMIKRYTEDDPQIDLMRRTLETGGLEAENEAAICFALGRAEDQLDRVDDAMKMFHRGNKIKKGLNEFSIEAERANTRRIIRSFPAEVFENKGEAGDPSPLPVFVLGMPRSGTTLVEQILDSHPRIHGAGEINHLWRIVSRVGEFLPPGRSLPDAVREVSKEGWDTLGQRYIENIRAYDDVAERIVDKLPFNYTLAGVIKLMLPNAHIVHCVRDPRDTCVSCYLTSFGGDRGFTSDLAELGETYRLYRELMDHWKKVLPGGIYEVSYEKLVSDQEAESRRLLEQIGMDWSDDCLNFHRNARLVTTASMTQVRQPAYKTSIARW
ncbi:MAG: tetratricopeptide repeat protein, partial [Gammaproteobacteria bacterium]